MTVLDWFRQMQANVRAEAETVLQEGLYTKRMNVQLPDPYRIRGIESKCLNEANFDLATGYLAALADFDKAIQDVLDRATPAVKEG